MNRGCGAFSLICVARRLSWLAALALLAMPAWAQPAAPTPYPLWVTPRWTLGVQADEQVEGTLALHLAATLRAGATVALRQREGMAPEQVPGRVAMAWVGWKLQPDWTLYAGLQHAGRRYADRAHIWSLPAYTRAEVALHWQTSADTRFTLQGFDGYDRRSGATSLCTTGRSFGVKRWRLKLKWKHRF